MRRGARLAAATTRALAARGRLLGANALARLHAAATARQAQAVLRELELGDGTAVSAWRTLLQRLYDDYRRILRSTPGDPAPFRALLLRHEAENLKLVWRACVQKLPPERWRPWWRPLGELALLHEDDWQDVRTPAQFAAQAAATPYATIAAAMARAQEPRSAEVALDRWVSQEILRAAERLPQGEADARAILIALWRERDALLRVRTGEIAQGAVDRAIATRHRACRRAFIGSPLRRAPALALLLLEEDRLAEIVAAAERALTPEV